MENMAIIGVIIPCYNVEKYVKRCFESLEKQTIGMAYATADYI